MAEDLEGIAATRSEDQGGADAPSAATQSILESGAAHAERHARDVSISDVLLALVQGASGQLRATFVKHELHADRLRTCLDSAE